ncbi:MAG: DUF87 domain-containing protein [Nanoarchaeota archaeon]
MIIGKNAETGEDVEVNLDKLIDSRAIITSSSGGGKSWTARKFLQESHGKVQQIILDWEGEYSNLREKFDYLLIGKGGEIPANIRTAEILAKKLMELKVSAIIDLSELSKHERILFVKRFLDSLLNLPKELYDHLVMLIIDEAHQMCLSSDTEILTDSGWRKYDEIKRGDLAWSYNKDLSICELKPIIDIIKRTHTGKINQLYNNDSIDCLVTDDHRVLCSKRSTDRSRKGVWSKLEFIHSKDLPTGIKVPIVSESRIDSSCVIDDDLIRILGWIITDGNRQDNKYYQLTQATSNPNKPTLFGDMKNVILRRFPQTSISLRKKHDNHKESARFHFKIKDSLEINLWLNNKPHRIPRQILSKASKHQLEILLSSLIEGDGHTQISKNGHKLLSFYPGYDEGLADDFQELCQKLGLSAINKINFPNQIIVKVSLRRKFASVRKIKKVWYSGIVWDITIENGAFICRRNGKPFITGNCPQKGNAESMNSVIDVMSLGRKRGIGTILLTQRIAKLNKDALTEAGNGAYGQMNYLDDRKRTCEEIGFNTKLLEQSIKNLNKGEFYISGSAITKEVIKVMIGDIQVKPPKIGARGLSRPSATPENIKKILKNLIDLPKEAEAELKELNDYKKKIQELKTKLTIAEKTQKVQEKIQEKIINITDDKALQKAKEEGFRETERFYKNYINSIEQNIKILKNSILKLVQNSQTLLESKAFLIGDLPTPSITPVNFKSNLIGKERIYNKPLTHQSNQVLPELSMEKQGSETYVSDSDVKLTTGAIRILKFIATFQELTRNKTKTLSGISSQGTFSTYVQDLKRAGFIKIEGDILKITGEGINFIGEIEPMPTDIESLINLWSKHLNTGAIRMLRICVDLYPEKITRIDLQEQSGITSQGTFSTYLQDLRRNGLVKINGNEIKASEELFE